jgi:D-sedoheptulose 7-phosphate isomerase
VSSLESEVRANFEAAVIAHQQLLNDVSLATTLSRWAATCARALKAGGTIFFAGNGGSFADAQHLAAEFTGRMLRDRSPLAGVALGTNSSSMSAIANDYGYETVFAREIAAWGRPGDVLIVLSTSGSSVNILDAVGAARKKGLVCLGLTGQRESELSHCCEVIRVPANRTDRIQELHILLGHTLCSVTDDMLRGALIDDSSVARSGGLGGARLRHD